MDANQLQALGLDVQNAENALRQLTESVRSNQIEIYFPKCCVHEREAVLRIAAVIRPQLERELADARRTLLEYVTDGKKAEKEGHEIDDAGR